MDDEAAAIATWQLGAASLVVMGVHKFVLPFFGEAVKRIAPRRALPGSIAGIALVLLGFLPLVETFRSPVVVSVAPGLLLYVRFDKGRLGGRLPVVRTCGRGRE